MAVKYDMRILIVSTFYYPNMKGGAEQSIKLLAENLVKRGHEVGAFCIDLNGDPIEGEQYHGVKVFRHTAGNFNLYKFSYDKQNVGKLEKVYQKLVCYYNKKTIREFSEVLSEFRPDVIHTNSTYGMSQFVWKAAYKLNIPVVHTIRDTAIVSPVTYGHSVNGFVLNAHRRYVKSLSKYVTAVTAPSEYTLNTSLVNNNFCNAIVKKCIFNSVAIDKEALIANIEKRRKYTSDVIKFVFAGRLVNIKGVKHMIEAFENLENNNTELHICGDGELLDYVKEKASLNNRIIVYGKLDNDELAKVLDECDVIIVPSIWPEPFGRVLIEGNLHGLPVIATNCGGMPEIIENTKAGIIYQSGNSLELKKCMEYYCSRDNIKEAFDNIIENIEIYDIAKQVDSFESIYSQLIQFKENGV